MTATLRSFLSPVSPKIAVRNAVNAGEELGIAARNYASRHLHIAEKTGGSCCSHERPWWADRAIQILPTLQAEDVACVLLAAAKLRLDVNSSLLPANWHARLVHHVATRRKNVQSST